MIERTGILPKAPLVYVLASVRFQRWMNLATKIGDIQDELRDRFPLFDHVVFEPIGLAQGQGSSPGEPSALRQDTWSFMNPGRTLGCQISLDQIVVHARAYTTFDVFADAVAFVVDAIEKHARHFDVNAIGIRYLDRISPGEGETLENYVDKGFLPSKLGSSFEPLGGMSQTVYATGDGVLQARFWTGNGYHSIPDDLLPVYILTQDFKSAPFTVPPLAKGDGVLDSDSIWSTSSSTKMQRADIIDKMRAMHAHANNFFRSVCSEHAFETWRKP